MGFVVLRRIRNFHVFHCSTRLSVSFLSDDVRIRQLLTRIDEIHNDELTENLWLDLLSFTVFVILAILDMD